MATLEELALQEQDLLKKLAAENKQKILDFSNQYSTNADLERQKLADSLMATGQKTYERNLPSIIEDLNSRGLFTSPTAVGDAYAKELARISENTQNRLSDFDLAKFNTLNDIQAAGLNADISGQQDALNSALELRRMGLQRQYDEADLASQNALAESLAKKQSRNNLIASLIGAGTNILTSGGLFGGGGAGIGGAGTGALGGLGGLGGVGSGMGSPAVSLGGILAGVGGGAYLGQKTFGGGSRLGSHGTKAGALVGSSIGTALGGPLGGALGGTLGAGVGKATSRALTGAKKIGKKIFCFVPETKILMDDGSEKLIYEVILGDVVAGGGIVESIRISLVDDGDIYNYNGVFVTGSHAVCENGEWKRIENTSAIKTEHGGTVYSLVTSNHRIVSNGIEFADEHETDDPENLNMQESLDVLNGRGGE